ncbi:MAG: hypothetical protein ACI94Y_002179 [Maribacter sp.]|jgi:hypothetical protein
MSKTDEKISVKGAIGELLYEHECVIVPKFGGFVKEYKPSSFDYVQGKISPPSSLLSFNDNLVVDDGLLIDFYKRKNRISLKKAQEDVKRFAKKSKITLENREVVSLPKVGRLLKDYENLIKFIPENHNFNTETFGLPKVRYYPILREIPENEEAVAPVAATATISKKRIVPKRKKGKRRSQQVARIAIPVVIVIMLASAYTVMSRFDNNKSIVELEEQAILNQDKIPVNVSPTEEPVNGDEELDNSTIDPTNHSDAEGHAEEMTDMETVTDDYTEDIKEPEDEVVSSSSVPDVVEASGTIIYVGYFTKQKGVDKTVAKIKKNNWTPYTKSISSGTRVGLIVSEGESANSLLKKVEKVFNEGAFIED